MGTMGRLSLEKKELGLIDIVGVQVVTVKAKYIVENCTGMVIEIKQKGTPDKEEDGEQEDDPDRCSRTLAINERSVCSIQHHSG